MLKKSYLFILMAFLELFLCQILSIAEDGILSDLAKSKKPIKVFVKEFANESGQVQISPKDFRKSLEDALLRRRVVKFEIAKSPDAGDIQISGTIKKYQYLKSDPVTTYMSPTGFVLDAMTTENYAAMDVEFVVMDATFNKTLWKETISTFVKKKMTEGESVPLICDKVARTFLWKCFGKPK